MAREVSQLEQAINAFYDEAGRHGPDKVCLQAGNTALIVHQCRPALADLWDTVSEMLGPDSELQLRLAGIAIRRLVAEERVTELHLSCSSVVRVACHVSARVELDVLA